MTENQISSDFMYIERLPTITELVISSYPTISQQFLGFKKLSFVGGTSGFKTDKKPEVHSRYMKSGSSA